MFSDLKKGENIMERIWIDAIEFNNYGEWLPETQFVREVGTAYLLASKKPGVPVKDATTEFTVKAWDKDTRL